MNLRYDPITRDILSPDNMIVATVSGIFNRADPTLGHKMAAAKEMFEALASLSHQGLCAPGCMGRCSECPEQIIRAALAKAKP